MKRKLTFEKAYLVDEWDGKITEGFASIVKQDYFGNAEETAIFTPNMEVFSFQTYFETKNKSNLSKGVYFTHQKALDASEKKKNERVEYSLREIENHKKRLTELGYTK